jgi:hypothetical protein
LTNDGLKTDLKNIKDNDVQKNAKGFNDAGVAAANRTNQLGQYILSYFFLKLFFIFTIMSLCFIFLSP